MQVKWLIESNAFEEQKRVSEEVVRQGMICKEAAYRPFEPEHGYLDSFDKNDCVVFYGSLGFGAQIRREAPWWVPGVYCDLNNYDCTKYYPAFSQVLLNSPYIMLPYGDLKNQKDFLYEKLGVEDAIFIRPNRGDKTFTGTLVFKEDFDSKLNKNFLSYNDIKSEELCVVAGPSNIQKEWRFVVVNQVVVAGSLYRAGLAIDLQTVEDGPVWDFAMEAAKLYNPDKVWTLDICQTKCGSFYVLEIGCFSCAGLYGCNLETVVREVSKCALSEWQDYQP